MGGMYLFFGRSIWMPRFDLRQGVRFEAVQKIVNLYTESFSTAHFNKRTRTVFSEKFEAKFFGGGRRKGDHFVGKVHARCLAFFGIDRCHTLSYDILRVRLP